MKEVGQEPIRVLFVCLGNICRSPLAEGVFRHLAERSGVAEEIVVDSAGTGAWHVGEPPDERATAVAKARGVALKGRARRIEPVDLAEFDYVLAMDRDNLSHIEGMRRTHGGEARVLLFRHFDPEADGDADVPDPYWGGARGFEEVYDMVHRTCAALLSHLDGVAR